LTFRQSALSNITFMIFAVFDVFNNAGSPLTVCLFVLSAMTLTIARQKRQLLLVVNYTGLSYDTFNKMMFKQQKSVQCYIKRSYIYFQSIQTHLEDLDISRNCEVITY